MKSRQKWFLFCVSFLFATAMLTGCAGNSDPTSSANVPAAENGKQEDTTKLTPNVEVTVALEAEATSLDPWNSTDSNSLNILSTMFEGLLSLDENGEIVPVLATDYKMSADATSLTFHLRRGVLFHDGTPFDAQVVKMNLDYVRNKANGMARASFFGFINEVTVVDPYTVTITANEPNSAMVAYMAHPSATFKSQKELQKKIDDSKYNLDRHPVGTGPYQFQEWKNGQYVKVVAFTDYWAKEKQAKLAAILFKPVIEASTRVNMLKAGEVDVVTSLPTLDARSMGTDSSLDVYTGPSLNVLYIGMNTKLDKYKDKRVRQALNYAVSKEQMISKVADGFGTVADSPLSPLVKDYAKQQNYVYDLDKAKELLAQAGYPNGFTATLWTRNSTEFVAIAENIKMQLQNIGVKIDVQAYESGTLFEKLDAGQGTDLYIGRWGTGTAEADWGLRPNFASDRVPPNYNNSGFYMNEHVDQLLDDALKATDNNVAQQKYAEAQKTIMDEAPWIFLYVPDVVIAKRKNVSDVSVTLDTVRLNAAYKQ
ncbi:glutathione ABC transporter substrate-binding protein [Brevibacillus choshinensis]|uniref:glutathione ABC transporter substrate-binding protein n=1 Tax=Brevibacillus choshinensis TaxID=54911 RepID=UPI002E1FE0A9|nr:glutathione ABC transporter substrate-binding protein [Brevibacillus choshinensis]